MSLNGEKRMMKKSDFAQKLLDDLRMRKEQLSIGKGNYAYSNKGFKRSKETTSNSTTFQDFNYKGTQQILPYGIKNQNMEKFDFSKALAFALENARKSNSPGSSSIIGFLHEIGKRSLGYEKSEKIIKNSQQPSSSSSQQKLPMIHVHIKEISKGTQKLNQLIKACSSGISFRKGKYSIKYGEQLMEGAIELEQSLRVLVDIQQTSEFTTKKNRIKLLDQETDEEEQEEEDVRYVNNRRIKEVAKADIEMRLMELNYQEDKNKKHIKQINSFQETEETSLNHKGRIPNVVAKLMGLGEFPQEDHKETNQESIKYEENLIKSRVMKVVETKRQRSSTTLDIARTENEIKYKAKSHHKDRENEDSRNIKRNKILHKKDQESTAKNVLKRNLLSTNQKKHKFVSRSQENSIKKEKLHPKKPQENGVRNDYSTKPLEIQRKLPLVDKPKALKKSFNSHVEVAQNVKEREMHCKSKIHEKKSQEVEAKTCIKSSQIVCEQSSDKKGVVEQKKGIKDDSILLIAAERVPCQDSSENKQHHGFIFKDVMDQQAPLSKCDEKIERLSETINKGTEREIEPSLPLLEKKQEHQREETTQKLSKNEISLKKIFVKSQLFLDTTKKLFKFKIPLNLLHEIDGNNNEYQEENKNLILDCGYEIMKRKGKFQELSVHPFVKVPLNSYKINSLDNLVIELRKEFEKLRGYTGSFVEDYLPKVLERDVNYKDLTLNSIWDMGWCDFMVTFIEKDDVVRDIEREIFSEVLEEIVRDLICI